MTKAVSWIVGEVSFIVHGGQTAAIHSWFLMKKIMRKTDQDYARLIREES